MSSTNYELLRTYELRKPGCNSRIFVHAECAESLKAIETIFLRHLKPNPQKGQLAVPSADSKAFAREKQRLGSPIPRILREIFIRNSVKI